MAYTIDLADLVAKNFQRLTTFNRHQLAGQVANLDFWIEEARHAISVLDNYRSRFEKLKTAQVNHAQEHHTVDFSLDDPCCTQHAVKPPRPMPAEEMQRARDRVGDALTGFLQRCVNERMLDERAMEQALEKAIAKPVQ